MNAEGEDWERMAIKVHGAWYSASSTRVIMVLLEKALEFQLVPVDIMINKSQKQPEHMALQPFGKIPVLQDGDFTIFESRAIVRYICDKYPNQGPNLYGSTLFHKAQVEQWLEVESQTFTPVVRILILHLLVGPTLSVDTTDSESVVAEYTEKLATILDAYETRLSRSKYLAGDFLSKADLSHVPTGYYYFNHAKQMELLVSRKHVAAWWEDISNRSSSKLLVENAGPSFDNWYRPRCATTNH